MISPLLANIYLHHVLDLWFQQEVWPSCDEDGFLVRYADDAVAVFSSKSDAERFLRAVHDRFAKYGLKLHPEKTRLTEFRRPPRGGTGKGSGSFDFLGFTFHWGRSKKGAWVVKQKTSAKSFRRSLSRISEWCRRYRHIRVAEQCQHLGRKLRGWYAYFGVTGNYVSLQRFFFHVVRIWQKWLARRSQRAAIRWDRFRALFSRHPLPRPRVTRSVYA